MIICQSRVIVPTTPDPYFGSVKLLMGFEGPNNSTTTGMDDESGAVHGVASGATSFSCVDSTHHKFGSSCLRLSGNSIWFADSGDWVLGSGHFTVETFVYPLSSNSQYFFVCQFGANAPNLGWVLYVNASNHLGWNVSTTGTNNLNDLIGTTALTANTWHHICVDYDGTKYRLYLDGVMEASSTTARNIYHPTGQNLGIGANSNSSSWWFPGYMDEIRITKGVARYASDSGFTVPTAAFPRS